jgi:hypothetical protein
LLESVQNSDKDAQKALMQQKMKKAAQSPQNSYQKPW